MASGQFLAVLEADSVPINVTATTWQRRISAAWRKSVEAILDTGRLLNDAKNGPNRLEHGQFIKMIESELPFKRTTAHMLMTIAADHRISNVQHIEHLPAALTTLYQLTTLSAAE